MDQYLPAHVHELRRVYETMRTWGQTFDEGRWLRDEVTHKSKVAVVDFFSATEDGYGHWKDGLQKDGVHPNDLGALLMFHQIDLRLFGIQSSFL